MVQATSIVNLHAKKMTKDENGTQQNLTHTYIRIYTNFKNGFCSGQLHVRKENVHIGYAYVIERVYKQLQGKIYGHGTHEKCIHMSSISIRKTRAVSLQKRIMQLAQFLFGVF